MSKYFFGDVYNYYNQTLLFTLKAMNGLRVICDYVEKNGVCLCVYTGVIVYLFVN